MSFLWYVGNRVVFSYNSIYEKLVITVIISLIIMELVTVINNFLYALF